VDHTPDSSLYSILADVEVSSLPLCSTDVAQSSLHLRMLAYEGKEQGNGSIGSITHASPSRTIEA
jgi:hypothetical protein